MIAYASRTGTKRTIEALKAAGWRWMVGPLDHGRGKLHGMRYALDNGAWPAFANGNPWDEAAFLIALGTYGDQADFVVVPDVVGNRDASLALTLTWLPRLLEICPARLLFAVQDGMQPDDVIPHLSDRVGIFIGGSTIWKERAIIPWGRRARQRGAYVHVGRVNTTRRINLCLAGGAHSFDGTSATRFAANIGKLDQARLQQVLL